jgi:peptidyl-prolyl cis-trans isomerase A (cyclophilin A)
VTPQPTFSTRFETSAGVFVLDVHHDWAPRAADRFFRLVQATFYTGARVFRVVPGFVVQFGLSGDPAMTETWRAAEFVPDHVCQTNAHGFASFAMRDMKATTQIFINLADNASLDERGFAPFARVSAGLDVVHRFYSGYGDCRPRGHGPDQLRVMAEGQQYLADEFPLLDYVIDAAVVEPVVDAG